MPTVWFACVHLASGSLAAMPEAIEMSASSMQLSYEDWHRTLHTRSEAQLRLNHQQWITFLVSADLPAEWTLEEWYALKNDIMDRLIQAEIELNTLAGYTLETVQARKLDSLWRDYCLQKMADLSVAKGLEPNTREHLMHALLGFANGREPGLVGTALIGQLRLLNTFRVEHPSLSSLNQRAYSVAKDTSAMASDRMTALQITTELSAQSATTELHQLVTDLLVHAASRNSDQPAQKYPP